MAEAEARIRVYNDSEQDQKRVRFYVGKSEMEGLTAANVKMYSNPFVLALWVALASAFIQFMSWWPKPEHGWFGYLTPLPAFVCTWLPIMFACDWFNRDDFINNMNNALRKRDLVKIKEYYTRSPSSGVYILEFGDRFIGFIAVDASQDSMSDEVVVTADSKTKVSFTKSTSDVATIRHFHVEEPYRAVNMQLDILQVALGKVFDANNNKVKTVKTVVSPLVPYVGNVLREVGFKVEADFDKVGMLGWKRQVMTLDRQIWEKRTMSTQ